jgi:indolepyruvate ferredoxin oxidoreductase beta subunit
MKSDILLCGVGGQGVLSIAATLASASLEENLHVKQSEVHGMSQRGGAVSATLRISDQPIHSPLIPRGEASLLLSMEPLEVLRYTEFLHPTARILTGRMPVKNIRTYPELEQLLTELKTLPRCTLVNTDELAQQSGSLRTANVVLVGVASQLLPLALTTYETVLRRQFESKGAAIVEMNLKAFHAGRNLSLQ